MKTPGIQWFKYASPQNFYFLAGKLWPWFAGLAAAVDPGRPGGIAFGRTHRCTAGTGLSHHLRACADIADVDVHLHRRWPAGRPSAWRSIRACRDDGQRPCAHGCPVRIPVAGNGLAGETWGYLVGMGCTTHVRNWILLFLYLGFLALQSSIDDPRRADKACAVLALVGVVNVPIIYFSVVWWNTCTRAHQYP